MSYVKETKQTDESQIKRFFFIDRVTELLDIAPRTVRLWVKEGRFPKPDGNVSGRNFWLESTLLRWQTAAIDGRFSADRRGWLSVDEQRKPAGGRSTVRVV